jgi:hypothetical protein
MHNVNVLYKTGGNWPVAVKENVKMADAAREISLWTPGYSKSLDEYFAVYAGLVHKCRYHWVVDTRAAMLQVGGKRAQCCYDKGANLLFLVQFQIGYLQIPVSFSFQQLVYFYTQTNLDHSIDRVNFHAVKYYMYLETLNALYGSALPLLKGYMG